jgi:hypothetical protein
VGEWNDIHDPDMQPDLPRAVPRSRSVGSLVCYSGFGIIVYNA